MRTDARRFVWTQYQALLGVAIAILGLTLVISPAAFMRERRLIARERVHEDMERMRRDAHDRVYNRLSALSKRIAVAGDASAPGTTSALSSIAEDIRVTVGDLQEILGEEVQHTNSALTSIPLADQVASVCAAQAARLGVDITCAAAEGLPEVDARLGWDLQCIAEESITNAVRHGGATHVRVQLAANQRELEISIADNGRGSTVRSCDEAPAGCTGLHGMLRRAEQRGGSLWIGRGDSGVGTVVRARIPV